MGIGLTSALSWPTISLCFRFSPPSQQALGSIWKCSCPFWSQGYRVGRRRCCEASEQGGQCGLRDTHSVLSVLAFCWAVFTWVLQRLLFLQLFLVEGHFFVEARAWLGWGAAQVRLSHSPWTWHLCEVREEHEFCLWGDAAAKNTSDSTRRILQPLGRGQEETSW